MTYSRKRKQKDELFAILSHSYRREVLSALHERESRPSTLEELSQHIATVHENAHIEQVKLSLHHVHLPKLREFGVIEYDEQSKTIRYHASKVDGTFLEECVQQDLELA